MEYEAATVPQRLAPATTQTPSRCLVHLCDGTDRQTTGLETAGPAGSRSDPGATLSKPCCG